MNHGIHGIHGSTYVIEDYDSVCSVYSVVLKLPYSVVLKLPPLSLCVKNQKGF